MKVAVKVTMAADARAGRCPTSSGLRLGQRSEEHPGAQGTAGEDLAEMQFRFNNRSPGNPTRQGLFDAYASWGTGARH
jgi:hypothetical protein